MSNQISACFRANRYTSQTRPWPPSHGSEAITHMQVQWESSPSCTRWLNPNRFGTAVSRFGTSPDLRYTQHCAQFLFAPHLLTIWLHLPILPEGNANFRFSCLVSWGYTQLQQGRQPACTHCSADPSLTPQEWRSQQACLRLMLNSRSLFYLTTIFCNVLPLFYAGSIPDVVTEIFHWLKPSSLTMALGSTQPLTKMSTNGLP